MQFSAFLASILLIYSFFDSSFGIDGQLFEIDENDMSPIHDLACEFQNIMDFGGNGTQKYVHLKEKFNSLMEMADIASAKIVQISNITNNTELLHRASQKLKTLVEKLKDFLFEFTNPPINFESPLSTEEERKELLQKSSQWAAFVNFPLHHLYGRIWWKINKYNMSGEMLNLQNLTSACVRQQSDTSPSSAVQYIKSGTRELVSAMINVNGPNATDAIYGMFCRAIVQLTFYQTLCDAALQYYDPNSDLLYRNSYFNETVVEIFLNTDVLVENSLAEYAAKHPDDSFASRFYLSRGLEVVLTLFCAYCLLPFLY